MKKYWKIFMSSILLGSVMLGQMSVYGEAKSEVVTPQALLLRQAELGLVVPDSFRFGIDDYVTGMVDSSIKKVDLYVNKEKQSSGVVFSDGTFEIQTNDSITTMYDFVEVAGLDRKGNELIRIEVKLEQTKLQLTAGEYTLYDDQIIGTAAPQIDSISLVINGDVYRTVSVNYDDTFILPIEADEIIETEDHVELVGTVHGKEMNRIIVPVNSIDLTVSLADYTLGNNEKIYGKLAGKAASQAKTARLYVNRKRYTDVAISGMNLDFTLDPLRTISSVQDDVKIAILNEKGQELGRYQVSVLESPAEQEQSTPISHSEHLYEVGHRYEKEWEIIFRKYIYNAEHLGEQLKTRIYSDENLSELIAISSPETSKYYEIRIFEDFKEVYVTSQEPGKRESVPVKVVKPAKKQAFLKQENIKTLKKVDDSWVINVTKLEEAGSWPRGYQIYGDYELSAESRVLGKECFQEVTVGRTISFDIPAEYERVYLTALDHHYGGGLFPYPSGGNRNETLSIEIVKPNE